MEQIDSLLPSSAKAAPLQEAWSGSGKVDESVAP